MTRKERTRRRRKANALAREHMHTIVSGPRRPGMLMKLRRQLRRMLLA